MKYDDQDEKRKSDFMSIHEATASVKAKSVIFENGTIKIVYMY